MANYIIYLFVSGLAFFIGAGMLVAGVGLSPLLRRRAGRIAGRSSVIAGLGLVWLSATPMPIWSFGALVVLTAIWLVAEAGQGRFGQRPLRVASCGMVVFITGCVLSELPYHLRPRLPDLDARTIYVVGDSISAGVGPSGEVLWPEVLDRQMPHEPVINLARAGETCASALSQARQVPERDAYVLVEIGGNDLLGRGGAAALRRDLEALLRELRRGDRALVMFELPLPPLDAEYGRIQRDLARRYGVALIPKRYFACIIMTPADTLDGLHLSPRGRQRMAETVADLLRDE